MWNLSRSMLCATIALSFALTSTTGFAAKNSNQESEQSSAYNNENTSKAASIGTSSKAIVTADLSKPKEKFNPEVYDGGGKKVYPFTPTELDSFEKVTVIEGEDNWSISTGLSDTYGNDYFGASYDVGASMSAETAQSAGTDGDILQAEAHLEASATVFSYDLEVLAIELKVETEYGQDYSGSLDVRVLGQSINPPPFTVSGSLNTSPDWHKTFFEECKWFTLGVVPVKVCASLSGELGYEAAIGLTVTGAAAEFTPFGGVQAEASASVDILIAGAGVRGDLTLIEASLPIAAAIDLTIAPGQSEVEWSLDADLQLSTLSGSLEVYAWLLNSDWELEIASWSGITGTTELYHNDGSFQLGNAVDAN